MEVEHQVSFLLRPREEWTRNGAWLLVTLLAWHNTFSAGWFSGREPCDMDLAALCDWPVVQQGEREAVEAEGTAVQDPQALRV